MIEIFSLTGIIKMIAKMLKYMFIPIVWIFKGIGMFFMLIVSSISGSIVYEYKDLDEIDLMDGHDFEYHFAALLGKVGYSNVKVTQGSGDHGIDVLATKNGKLYAFQCKRYDKNVGNDAVQQAYSGKAIYDADHAVVITNQYYTKQAIGDAKKLGVELWNRDKLHELILLTKKKTKNEKTAVPKWLEVTILAVMWPFFIAMIALLCLKKYVAAIIFGGLFALCIVVAIIIDDMEKRDENKKKDV